MAQVRARRPFTSRRGRVNDAARGAAAAQQSQPAQPTPRTPEIETIQLPPHPDDTGEALPEAVEGDSTERESPGTGEQLEAQEAQPDGTETELSTVDAQRSKVDYSQWTVTQLTTELKKRELPSSGAKPELVKRLEESDDRKGT